MKKICVLIFIFTAALSADNFAQDLQPRQKYFTFGFNYSPFGVGFSQHISGWGQEVQRKAGFISRDNGRGGHSLAGFNSIGLNTGFTWSDRKNINHTAIIIDLQQNRVTYSFNQPLTYSYTSTHRGGDGDSDDRMVTDTLKHIDKWADMDRYLKYSISVQRFWLLTDRYNMVHNDGYYDGGDDVFSYLKLSFGQSFLHRNMGHLIKQGDFETHNDGHGNIIEATTTSANSISNIFGAELGFRIMKAETRNCLDIGLGCVIPVQSTYTRNYNLYTEAAGGSGNAGANQMIKKGSSEFQLNGGSIYLNVSYSFNSRIKQKEPDTLMHEEKYHEKAMPVAHVHRPHHLNGRKVRIHHEIDSDEETLIIQVYDKGKVDGDRISLYLNGELLLENYTVGKIKKELTLHLKPGENYLVMHALNLGRVPPNTAAIRIYKNGRPKDIILNSDMDKSGGLKINFKGENG